MTLPKDIKETFSTKIKDIIPEIKEVEFTEPQKEKTEKKDSQEAINTGIPDPQT